MRIIDYDGEGGQGAGIIGKSGIIGKPMPYALSNRAGVI